MNELIEVYRMKEIPPETRARIIIKLGVAINKKYSSNITEPIVYELVKILEPNAKILRDETFLRMAKE